MMKFRQPKFRFLVSRAFHETGDGLIGDGGSSSSTTTRRRAQRNSFDQLRQLFAALAKTSLMIHGWRLFLCQLSVS
jgi:hypothetical protein